MCVTRTTKTDGIESSLRFVVLAFLSTAGNFQPTLKDQPCTNMFLFGLTMFNLE